MGDWKLIDYGRRRELYHLTDDPREIRNRSRNSPEPLHALTAELPPLRRQPGLLRTVRVDAPIQEVRAAEDPLRALGYIE